MASSGTNGTIKWAISGTTLRLYPANGSSGTANPLRSGAADGLIMWITLTDSERLAITKIKTEGTLLFNTNAIGGGYTPLTQYRALTTYSGITKYFTNLEEIDVSGLKAAGATDFEGMFSNSTGQRDKLTKITGLSSLNTSSATNYESMFEGTKVPSLDISSFKNMNTANICEMFRDTPYLMSVKLPSSFARESDARTTNFGLAPATNANGITVKYDSYFFKLPSSQQGGLWTRNVTGDLKFSARATRTSSGAEIHCVYSTTKASTAAFYIKKQTDSSWPNTSVATMSFSSSGSADQTIELPTDDSYDILINVSDGDTTLYVIPSVTSNKLLFAIDSNGYVYPKNEKMTDWVTEQGTNGSWKYRKWHSGKVEAWTRWNVGTVAITTASPTYGGYRSGEKTLSIPSGIFTVAPFAVGVKSYSQGGWLSHIRAASATSITVFYGAGASTTIQNQTIDVYAWQN